MAPTPVDEARFPIHDPPHARKGAVLLLLYPGEKGCAIPFIKRPTYVGFHSAQVSFPGGKWEDSDGNLETTALRETQEEIGVDGQKIDLIGHLSNLYIPPSNFLITPYIGYIQHRPEFHPHPREVERIIHCDFSILLDKKIRKKKSMTLRKEYTVLAPYFEIDQEVVWGATAMILSELLMVWEGN
jgi:8-oxo-dGTP pyrophosphatase MutT (NUDIX family)